MKRLDRILAVVDPTVEAQCAVGKAARIARSAGAVLELFICDYDPALSGRPFADTHAVRTLREEFLEERTEYLEYLADELRVGGLTVETHVHWDNPLHRGILARIRESEPDLVVKDTHYQSVLRRSLFSNTDWHLVRACPAPLLLAKPGEWPAQLRLLAAIDPGHLSDKPAALDHDILDFAGLLAGVLDGEVHAVHAFLPAALLALTSGMDGFPLGGESTIEEIVATERKRVAGTVQQLAASHGVPAARVHLLQGSATEVLPRAVAESQADIVLMGAVSRSRFEEVFVGSTAERILDRLPGDVLVVKPPDFAAVMPA